jgi:two-component system, NtrC family, nitrogen regulation sensor histidine kinase GlnL
MDHRPIQSPRTPLRDPAAWPFLDQCATAMAVIDRDLLVRAANQALCDWLGSGTRSWRGEAIAMLDAKPPQLADAALRASGEQRRIWLRDARLRTAMGDRAADLAFTPLDDDTLLIEVQAPGAETAGLRLSESLRGFAHEVKGPLAGVRGAAQLLRRHLDAPDMAELAELIMTEVDRVAALSDRLLRAGGKPRLARTNIHEVVERVAALLAAEPSAPRIRRDYDPSLPAINADADRLQQALLNLARNAVEAGAQTLALRTRAEHAARLGERTLRLALRVDVTDDGRGVPTDLAETLFEPLVSGRPDGTGLGLAIAREIAREHGGDLIYASRPGTTVFTLMLPVTDDAGRGA